MEGTAEEGYSVKYGESQLKNKIFCTIVRNFVLIYQKSDFKMTF